MKKSVCVAMALLLVLTVFSSTYAVAAPRYSYIYTIGGTLSINSFGVANCTGQVTSTTAGGDGTLTVTLQKAKNGTWENVKSWSATGSAVAVSMSKYYAVPKDATYRVYVVGTVYDVAENELETKTYTSSEVDY
jgi:hypothetical protein